MPWFSDFFVFYGNGNSFCCYGIVIQKVSVYVPKKERLSLDFIKLIL